MEEQENPGFFCCVSLLSHANEKVSALQCSGTRCRCVSDAQFNEWSKVEKPDTLSYLFIQWNKTAWREMETGTLELGIKGSPSLLWPVKLIIRHYHWSQKVEGIQKRMSCLLRKCKCLVISQKTLKTKYKPSCFRWLPNLKITGE